MSAEPLRNRVRIGYVSNAFPGETMEELVATVTGPLRRVRDRLCGVGPLGLELRLSAAGAAELSESPAKRERLCEALAAGGFEVVSFNAFSPSAFNSRRVKEDAYRPTWLEIERSGYTRRVADIFAEILPLGGSGSVSTSPGSFKAFDEGEELLTPIAEAYAEMAHYLAEVEERRGRHILLSIEPEPGCTMETTEELIDFFERRLLTAGRQRLATQRGCSQAEDREALTELARFSSSPYMHQIVGVDAEGRACLREADLPKLLAGSVPFDGCRELRVHFHLPLYLERLGELDTTALEARSAVRYVVEHGLCDTTILETCTWKLLERYPGLVGEGGVEEAVAEEIRWACERLFVS